MRSRSNFNSASYIPMRTGISFLLHVQTSISKFTLATNTTTTTTTTTPLLLLLLLLFTSATTSDLYINIYPQSLRPVSVCPRHAQCGSPTISPTTEKPRSRVFLKKHRLILIVAVRVIRIVKIILKVVVIVIEIVTLIVSILVIVLVIVV